MLGSPDKRWLALYTRSRHEKVVQRELDRKGVESFLPLRKVHRRWSDRRKVIEEPVFKGYVFVHIPLDERGTVLTTTGAVNFVGPSPGVPWEVSDVEVDAIKRFVERDLQIDPHPYLKEGSRVVVRSGPLQGVEGFVIRKRKDCRLVISVPSLMQSVSVEISEADLDLR